jgi:hypothetical protein
MPKTVSLRCNILSARTSLLAALFCDATVTFKRIVANLSCGLVPFDSAQGAVIYVQGTS